MADCTVPYGTEYSCLRCGRSFATLGVPDGCPYEDCDGTFYDLSLVPPIGVSRPDDRVDIFSGLTHKPERLGEGVTYPRYFEDGSSGEGST